MADRAKAETLVLPHGVDRIEALGADAIAVGTDGKDLHFSSIQLGPKARAVGHYVQPQAAQGETRSHGFFYKPDGAASAVVGLPVRGAGQGGYRQLWDEPAGMLYLRNNSLNLHLSAASRPAPVLARTMVAALHAPIGMATPGQFFCAISSLR